MDDLVSLIERTARKPSKHSSASVASQAETELDREISEFKKVLLADSVENGKIFKVKPNFG